MRDWKYDKNFLTASLKWTLEQLDIYAKEERNYNWLRVKSTITHRLNEIVNFDKPADEAKAKQFIDDLLALEEDLAYPIYSRMDELFCDGWFAQANRVLEIATERLEEFIERDTVFALSFASCTFVARDKLPARTPYAQALYKRMIDIKGEKEAKEIMAGLVDLGD